MQAPFTRALLSALASLAIAAAVPSGCAGRQQPQAGTPAEHTHGHGEEHADTARAGAPGHRHGSADASELSETEAHARARPVFERYCGKCHTTRSENDSALQHFEMDGYPFGGHHAGDIGQRIRSALGQDGAPATMPKDRPGVVQNEDLEVILDWAAAFDRTHGQAHDMHDHGEHQHDH